MFEQKHSTCLLAPPQPFLTGICHAVAVIDLGNDELSTLHMRQVLPFIEGWPGVGFVFIFHAYTSYSLFTLSTAVRNTTDNRGPLTGLTLSRKPRKDISMCFDGNLKNTLEKNIQPDISPNKSFEPVSMVMSVLLGAFLL